MESAGIEDAPKATAAAGETEEDPLESIWDCDKMKRTADPVGYKEKIECLHCGMVATFNSTKFVHHEATKI